MPICTAQTPINDPPLYPVCQKRSYRALTLIEMMVVIVIASLLVATTMINLTTTFRRHTFKSQVQEFLSTMQMAASSASESDRRYEVIIDLTEQAYMLREITSPDLSQVLEEEIIIENNFSDNCRAVYVLFDDGEFTNQDRAKFRAGRSGWQYGGKVVLLDEDGQPYSVLVNRLNRIITLKRDDVEILLPKSPEEVPF